MSARFTSRFEFGDRVHIDGDDSIVARVIGFSFVSNGNQVQVSWFHNGDVKEAWFAEWRLSKVTT